MWKEYFSFNKRQRNGIIVLVSLIILMIGVIIILDNRPPVKGNFDFTGFKAQLAETENIPSSRDSEDIPVKMERPKDPFAVKLDLNNCTVKELARVPGIGYYRALAVVNYREMHGPYRKTDDLLKCKAVDDSSFRILKPFVIPE